MRQKAGGWKEGGSGVGGAEKRGGHRERSGEKKGNETAEQGGSNCIFISAPLRHRFLGILTAL